MSLYDEVMIASADDGFLDAVADALQREGAVAICVRTVEDAREILDDGFRPDALVVDGTLASGPTLVARLSRHHELRGLRVIAAAPLAAGALPCRRLTVVRRYDVKAVVAALSAG